MLFPFDQITSSRELWNFRTPNIPTAPTEGGHTLLKDGIRYTVTQEKQGELTLRKSTIYNETDHPVTLTPPSQVFAFLAGEYQVYAQSSIQLAESQGQWLPLITQIGVYSDSIRTTRGGNPFMALWSDQIQRGFAFHVITNSTWHITANRHYAPSGIYSVQVRVSFYESPSLTLAPGETLELPQVLYYTFRNKLDMDCWKLHRWYNQYHGRTTFPIVYNTWLYKMDRFTPDDIKKQIPVAAELGMEYFVVDAGWFGIKGKWFHTVGDWEESSESAMEGQLSVILELVRSHGMKFGLWFEIERGGKESQIILNRPELFAQGPFNKMLDFGRQETHDYVNTILDEKIAKYGIEYIKFDLNSDLCTIPEDPNLTSYFNGYRRFLQQLRQRHPGIYLECCASGGMRFDLTNALHFESCWLSDNQSPVHTMRIFKDSVRRLPPQFIEKWITAKMIPDSTRLVAPRDADWVSLSTLKDSWLECMMLGSALGFTCDIASFSEEKRELVKQVIAEIKANRTFWMQVECHILCDTEHQLTLQYNDPNFERVEITAFTMFREQPYVPVCPEVDVAANYQYGEQIISGKELSETGIFLPAAACYTAARITLKKI